MSTLSPREIVSELDRHVVSQNAAKRAVAIALRNRWRRQQLDPALRAEIRPHNILMIGPTGVGKTEISRRLARLAGAPFLKVEATKFTEVGYVGRDVDSIIRDLIEAAVVLVREKRRSEVHARAQRAAEDRIVEVLVGKTAGESTKEVFLNKLRAHELDDREIEIAVNDQAPSIELPGQVGVISAIDLGSVFNRAFGGRQTNRKMTISQAYETLTTQEADKLLDNEQINREAVALAENEGIVFIDEVDKICGREGGKGPDISREGVQRDLLPLIEGTTVTTKYGAVRSDHVLFIASGAFHITKPSDLLPELQGRLPIRVELQPLTADDFIKILCETDHNLCHQMIALMKTEGITVNFTPDAIKKMADIAAEVNMRIENIGARRLHTIMERVMDDLSFTATDRQNETVTIDADYVESRLKKIAENHDISRYIL